MHYNSRVHTATKFTPYEIMENRFDQNILKQVRDNTLKSRKDRKIKEFEEGQNILISNYVITITMLLCKELILIRGQPPRQGGSPRATLDRGEFT